MKTLISLFCFLIIASIAGCSEEQLKPREYPRVRTREVTNISNASAAFQGEVTLSSVAIIDHGFLWSTEKEVSDSRSTKISLGPLPGAGAFHTDMGGSPIAGNTYFVKAYAKSDKNTVYGEVVQFALKR
jgi:hypothetical protein